MSSEAADTARAGTETLIRLADVAKYYHVYAHPRDRLKQFLLPPMQRRLGLTARTFYQEFRALDQISLDIRRTEAVGIIGRNGSGKSTLLQLICGTLVPTLGQVTTYGRVAALLELGAGFDPEFSGRENVYLNASLMGLGEAEIDARMDAILAFADIGDFIDKPVKTYSSGMFVRLAFAVIAHVDVDVLVIDEALAVGDVFFVQKCMRFLRRFMETGTLLFVSHSTDDVINLCDRAIWLEGGKVVADGTPKQVTDAYLKAFFEGFQGSSAAATEGVAGNEEPTAATVSTDIPRDMRQDVINGTPYRNDLEIFDFDPTAAGFGKGGALIEAVTLQDTAGRPLYWVVGGEEVILVIRARVQPGHSLRSPILGFYVKNYFGQTLFSDNTFFSYQNAPVRGEPGCRLTATFRFRMPILAQGDYVIGAAVADGSQHEHVQHHWMHDALYFKSHASSQNHGLVGIPVHAIELAAFHDPE